MVFFNDPVPQPDHAERAVRLALAMRDCFDELNARWSRLGYELGLGIGIATGYATLGRIGFEGRYDYGMVGTAVIVASRLSSAAESGQILLNPRVHAAVEAIVHTEPMGEMQLKGFSRPVPTVNVVGLAVPEDSRAPRSGSASRTGDSLGAFLQRHVIAFARSGVDLARAADAGLRVADHLPPVGDPARQAADGEQHGEHVRRECPWRGR